jgi:hypothetical protein
MIPRTLPPLADCCALVVLRFLLFRLLPRDTVDALDVTLDLPAFALERIMFCQYHAPMHCSDKQNIIRAFFGDP